MNYVPRDWYWIVGGDETRVHASARAAFVPADDAAYAAWRASGNAPTSIGSFDELKDVLRAAGVPPFHKVSTYRVLRRLEDAGRIDAAEAALNANRVLWRRFYTVGAINADDADSRAFLATIGADADAILAPE
jgi:hypothetical protein